jgi:choline dehydrogenase
MKDPEFDFVVIGAGSAGCVLANRLSSDGRFRVGLLEAGPRDTNPWIHLPIGYGKTMWDTNVNWAFHTQPDPNMGNRRIYWPRGRVLGGSSSINGLIAIRGQHEDYDHWRDLGNVGWGWSDVLPYFIKLENNQSHSGDPLHGTDGPVAVSSIPDRHELIEAVIAAAEKLGVARTDDFNGASQEGVGYFQLTTRNGLRMSSAKAYLAPARGRSNLTVLTNAHATRILWRDGKAVGVRYRRQGRAHDVNARCGVVLSAGALQSPQLLMLSGVGPAKHLQKHGIPVVVDRSGVGANLQDHLQLRLIYRCTKPITTNDQLNSLFGRVRIGAEWLLHRSGPLAIGINQGGLFTRVLAESTTPDIQFHIATLSADKAGARPHPFSGFTLSVCQLRPTSRGHVELASHDPLAAPLMFSNYLSTENDRRCAVAAISFARKLGQTEPLASYVERELQPGAGAKTDNDLLEFARQNGATIFHPSGTCRMGGDADAVVDARLRVRGVRGLWVADCSIMPTLVSGNTNLPVMMIAEKASDMIMADAMAEQPARISANATAA